MKCGRREVFTRLAALGASSFESLRARPQPLAPRRILLAHGLLGFSKIGDLAYFNGVRGCFDNGCEFIEPQVAPTGTIKGRAQQLEDAIRKVVPGSELNHGGAIHIVAHSMGGLDARYLISSKGLKRASWFASVTTISTPHRGSPLADVITGRRQLTLEDFNPLAILARPDYWLKFFKSLGRPDPSLKDMFSPQGFAKTRDDLKGYFSQIFDNKPDAFEELTSTYTAVFNSTYTGWEGVPLRSYAGVSTPDETMSSELYGPWAILKSLAGNNDGVVPQSSSSWDNATAEVVADHFEEVGLASRFDGSLGIRKHFDVCNLYRAVNRWQAAIKVA
jgi:triacylglycerol esterase/lipase EstA (alpha/beta hydrolase family)